MTVVTLNIPDKIYKSISKKWKVSFEDIVNYQESLIEYEKVWMKAWNFKSYLIKELWNG